MKKVLSFLLSIVMIFSVVSAVDLSAYANDDKEPVYLTEDDALFELVLTEDNIQYFKNYFLSDLDPTKQAFYIDHLTEMNHENSETYMQIVQDSVNRVQKTWNQVLDYMPETITDSQIVSMGNKAFSYLNGTIEIFKNIEYIVSEDERATQICYHGLKAVNTALSICGVSLGPVSVVLKALENFFIFADILYVTFTDAIVNQNISNYDLVLSMDFLAYQELTTPKEHAEANGLQSILGEDLYNKWYEKASAMYLYACMKVISKNMEKYNTKKFTNCMDSFDVISWDRYTGNMGDSYIYNLDGTGQPSLDSNHYYNRYGNKGVDGTYYQNGFEIWLARWNFTNEISWVESTYKLPNNYNLLTGKLGLINSYNITRFDTSFYFYGDEKLIGEYTLNNYNYKNDTTISLDVSGYKSITIIAKDNVSVSGGTSYALYDLFLYSEDPYPTINDEHHYVQNVIAPTCTTDGYTINKCTDCELEYYSNNVTKLGHNCNFSRTVTPTCTAQGYDLYSCTRCNNTEKRNTINALGHNYQYQKTVAPTCSAQGYDLYKCTHCTSTENRNKISSKGHNYTFTKTVAPACTAQGYDLYTCSVCNGTEKRNTVDATGHTYEEKSNTATCTDAGVKTTVCSKCGDTKTSDVSALGHSYRKVYTVPTCTEDGGYTNTCTRCGDVTHSIYEAKGHDYGNLIGKDYIDKISGSSISTAPNYFNQYYHTSSSIGSNSNATLTSTNMAVPNEIRLDINDIAEVKNYQFAIKGSLFSRKNCSAVFAYDKTTGRTPEQSAIPYTDKDGNLIDFTYVDYKVNGNWQRGHYKLDDNNQIIDLDGNVVCSKFEQTRTHIHYTKQEALDLGFMYNDGTINAVDVFEKYEGVWFSAGIPGVYFTADNISPPMNARRFIDVFGYDKTISNSIKPGKYDVDLCFYNPTYSGLSSTTFKIYDDSLINKTPATVSTDEKVTYTCMDCGETHTDTCKLNIADFKIKTISLSLESSITMNFKVLKSAVADFKNPYVVFNCEGDELTVTDYSEQGDYYVFSYPGISPQLMNDDVKAVLHATHNGIDYTSPEKVMSVRTYAYTMIDRYSSDDYAELRTLLVDLLNYGAASQKYIGYQTDNLVNADLTDEQKSWGTSTAPTFENIRDYDYKTIANPTSKWIGSGLVLNNSVMVRAKFTADSIENKTVKITCGKGEFTYTKDDFVQDKDGNYYVYCNEIFANEMSEEILLTVYDNGVQCSNTMRFSIESYAKLVHDNYTGNILDELTTAMMRYGNSAKAYGA